jgi:hypothetical protein
VAPFADHGFDGAPNSFGAQLVEPVITRFAKQVTGGRLGAGMHRPYHCGPIVRIDRLPR